MPRRRVNQAIISIIARPNLMTPIMDLGDIVANPTRTNGLTFFYAGSAQTNDNMKVYALDDQGAWDELRTRYGTVSATLSIGRLFQTTWGTTPLIPTDVIPFFPSNSNSNLHLRAIQGPISILVDDFVIVYDQAAKTEVQC